MISGGTAYCWGDNFDGQLGDGTVSGRTSPSSAISVWAFTSISAGSYHTCGIDTSGNAYCWGWNGFGQNGNGAAFEWTGPVPVSGSFSFKSLATVEQQSCGATTANSLYCWGSNQMPTPIGESRHATRAPCGSPR